MKYFTFPFLWYSMIVKFNLIFIQPTSLIRYHIKRILAPYSYYVNRICHKAFLTPAGEYLRCETVHNVRGCRLWTDRSEARDGAIGPVDQCSAPTEEDFKSSETSNGISQIPFEPDRALFAQKRGIHRMPLFAQNKSARRDSNPRPRPWQGRAPPTEPLAHFLCCRSPQRQIILYMIYLHLSITFFKKFWGTFLFLKCASNHDSC